MKDTGVELDSHITLMYAQGKVIPKDELLMDIKTILGIDWVDFESGYLKSDQFMNVFDLFEISNFENDSDYIVLKLKKDSVLFNYLSMVNKGICLKYDINSEFKNYTPHMTLAELNPKTSKKYLESDTLHTILNDSLVNFEDLMISYGTDNEVEDRKQIFLTQNKCVDRYFRLERLKREEKELQD